MQEELDDNWHFAGLADEFEDEDIEQVKIGPLAIAIYRAMGGFYATQDLCTHERAFLSDGVLIDCVVECPFHQGRFDVRTGKALSAPVFVPLKTYPLRIVDGKIYVNVSRSEAEADAAAQTQHTYPAHE
jgi:3-phenylpropionate/trans-cinnamate dioxygenase ferredoxin subunit